MPVASLLTSSARMGLPGCVPPPRAQVRSARLAPAPGRQLGLACRWKGRPAPAAPRRWEHLGPGAPGLGERSRHAAGSVALVPVKLRRQLLHRHVELKAVHVAAGVPAGLVPLRRRRRARSPWRPAAGRRRGGRACSCGDLARELCLVGRGFRGRARLAEVPDQILLPAVEPVQISQRHPVERVISRAVKLAENAMLSPTFPPPGSCSSSSRRRIHRAYSASPASRSSFGESGSIRSGNKLANAASCALSVPGAAQ